MSATNETALVQLRGISRSYDGQVKAVDAVDLEIRSGEMLALTGPSGSGKSTLLTILGLLDVPDQGDYVLSGHPTRGLSVDQRAQLRNRYLGMVFQAFHLLPDLSVRDNVALPLRYRRGVSRADAQARAQAQLERVGLADYGQRLPQTLSGGQQQRVAIARALVGEPVLLLADEPTGNLDQRTSGQIIELFQHVHQSGVTVVVITHDPQIAAQAPRQWRMLDGRLSAA